MMPSVVKKINSSLILAIIISFNIITAFIWLKIDKSYLKLDAWGHYRYSLEVFEFLKGIFRGIPFSSIEPMKWHGFLPAFITAPFYFIFGNAQDTAIMINSVIFFAILILATYGIAKKLFNERAGLLAAFILSAYPIIFNNLRLYMLDLPLTGMVALSLYFLVSCDNFKDTKNSLLLGLSLGLGLLVKFNYGAFIIGPLMLVSYNAFRDKSDSFKNMRKNFFYLITAAILLSLGFYMARSADILHRIIQASYLDMLKDKDFYFPNFISLKTRWLLKFIEIFIGEGMSFLLFLAFVIGLVFFIKTKLKNRWLIYLAAVVPLSIQILFFLIPPECMYRYCMPILPVTAIISALGISSIKNLKLKKIVVVLLVPLSLIQFFAVSYGIPLLPQEINLPWQRDSFDFNLIFFKQNMSVPPFLQDKTSHPSLADWKSSEVLSIIRSTNTGHERVKVISLSNIPEIFEAMEYQILTNRELIDLLPASSIMSERFYDGRTISLDKICLTANYIIISENIDSSWESAFETDPIWKTKIEKARKILRDNIANYKLIWVTALPDHSLLSIYKNISQDLPHKSFEIRNSDIRFLFDNGRGRIFYKNIEVTKGLGLYTSLFALQYWRDSMEAAWKVTKLSDTKLTAEGRWMFIPVSQVWKVELKEGDVIDWQVEMRVHDKLKIEVEDFKLMLTDKYKEWFTSDGKNGFFPDYFEEKTWRKIWVGQNHSQIGVKSVNLKNMRLPEVRFQVYQLPPESQASIENSDQLFNGRAIGCFKSNSRQDNLFSPKRYKYFSAKISLK
jgi:4-amino-4-deoxy-L-arabinose transferase-like glycosyltransferase